MRKALFILPNLFTLSSVFFGSYAVFLCGSPDSADDTFYRASLLILFAMLCDSLDGRVARLTRTQSAFGVQIDSLADIVSFGVAPAMLVYRWSLASLGFAGVLISFAFIACGTVRLARFNVLATDRHGVPKTPTKYTHGLPIPAAAAILTSLVVANHAVTGRLPAMPYIIALLVLTLSFFMVSAVRFRSFKDLRFSWRSVILVCIALLSSVMVTLRFHISFALVWLLASYVLIGVIEAIVGTSRRTGTTDMPEPLVHSHESLSSDL